METLEICFEELVKTFKLEGDKLFRIFKNKGWKEVSLKCNTSQGYCYIKWNGKRFMAHRILFSLYHKCDVPTDMQIDHENGRRDDNQIENLRLVTHRENGGNRECHRNGNLVGATWDKRDKKWKAQITISNKKIHLGLFPTELEAHNTYLKAKELIDQFIDGTQFRKLLKHSDYLL